MFVDYWTGAGTWAAMPDERRQNTMAMLPPVVHEWDMATTGLRPLEGWRAITAPVHLIHAADTRAPTRAIVDLLAKTYPDWRVDEVPSGGHMAPLARPDLVNPLIAAAIDGAARYSGLMPASLTTCGQRLSSPLMKASNSAACRRRCRRPALQ